MNTQELDLLSNLSSKIDSLTASIDTGFSNINIRLDSLEARQQKVGEGILGLDRRLLVVETKTDSVDNRLGTVKNKLPDISEKFGE